MKANSLEEFVTNSNIAGELRNYTDWHTRLVKFAQLVADWQKEQDEAEKNLKYFYGLDEGAKIMKEQMMKDAVEGKVNQDGFLELSNGEVIDICPTLKRCALGLHIGDKVRIVVLKEKEE